MTWLAVKAFLGRIPRGAWIGAAVVALLLLGSCVHARKVKQYGNERYAAGVKHEGDRIAAKALKIAKQAGEISAKAKDLNNETNRRIAGDARTIVLQGPGKASCLASTASSPGRRIETTGQGSPAVDQVPTGERIDLIGLPFAGTVALGQTCDLNRAEAETWRAWHRDLTEAWRKAN